MLSNTLVRWVIGLVCVFSIFGCERQSNPPETTTKTAAEYKAEADKQINEQNMSQELSKLEQEIQTDAAQP